ncbi:MAG: pyridoxal-phosphate dependent enzyme, partial [Acidobacteriota bacterium]|nr:pyridoxal-phosphate dependent enzyme [Acidobacteriota bacterium]
MSATEHVITSKSKTANSVSAVGESIVARIGNTPLLRLARIGREFDHVEFCGKAEWFNPGGSVKDRPALAMIQDGLKTGALLPGKTIIDAT